MSIMSAREPINTDVGRIMMYKKKINNQALISGMMGKFSRPWYDGYIMVSEQEIRRIFSNGNAIKSGKHRGKILVFNPYRRYC